MLMENKIRAELASCRLCPRNCGADRLNGKGFCGGGEKANIALVSLHPWEEPVIAGDKGAGTVFFSGCNLRCVFCQNYEISHESNKLKIGSEVSDERLAEIFLEQQARGVATLDLVTPTHYVLQIIHALDMAKEKGFRLPVVYNSSGYEKAETIEMLKGYVDVFLPDLKYYDSEAAKLYSGAEDYFSVAKIAIKKMVEITKPLTMQNELMIKGVLVRHLVLPGHRKDSMKLLDWLWQEFGEDIYISLMNQYTPMYRAKEFPKLKRTLTTFEYQSVVDYAYDLGFRKCLIQSEKASGEEFVPEWTGDNVL